MFGPLFPLLRTTPICYVDYSQILGKKQLVHDSCFTLSTLSQIVFVILLAHALVSELMTNENMSIAITVEEIGLR